MQSAPSASRLNSVKDWSDAHPAKPDPTRASGAGCWGKPDQEPGSAVIAAAERPHLPWLVPGADRL